MPKKIPPKIDPNWCQRCKEREESPDPKIPLENPLREKFCQNVAIHGMKGGAAYMAAGFTTKNASRASHAASSLRKRIEIANRIEALLERQAEYALETREWVDAQLKEVVNRCMQKVPVLDRQGKPCGEWKFDGRNANAALHLMGKDRGMFVDKVEINQADAEFKGKSEAEIQKMIAATFTDLGRSVCLQIIEEAFGLKYEGIGGTDADPSKEPTPEPDSTVH
jgi:hypothetical protein